MRAAILNEINQPMTVEDLPTPSPRAGEVLLRIAATGVCHTDLHVMKGEVAFPTPCVLGHETSGIVEAVGDDVTNVQIGDRVVCSFIMPCGSCAFCRRGRDDMCETFFAYNRLKGQLYDGTSRLARPDSSPVWMYSMGALAEYAVTPASSVFRLPDAIPLREAAIIGCSVFTAYGAVRNQAELRMGESAAVVGVGGVGTNVIQIAAAVGASPLIAVDIDDAKLELAQSFGATHSVNAAHENVPERIREITGGNGVDAAFEALGKPDTVQQAFQSVADGGRVVMIGIASAGETVPLEITRIVRRGVRIIGSYGARAGTDMPQILDLVERGVVDVSPRIITRRYPIEQVNDAYATLGRGEVVGRALIEF